MQLESQRMVCRRFTEADVELIYALDNDTQVMRYINGGTPTPRDIVVQQLLPTFLEIDNNTPGLGFWAALEKPKRDFMGWFCLRPSEPGASQEVILGYRLHQSAWGRGLATEGVRMLLAQAFDQWHVERVVATTYEYNHASRRVLEKAGFSLERRFRLSPEAVINNATAHSTSSEVWEGDDIEYVLDRQGWRM